ncbi:MAG TPA: hypothetical protein VK590_15475, partial [Saprospiraceae bacterium]|nr:hypothetical protein [Saprospiraceae bacterium]
MKKLTLFYSLVLLLFNYNQLVAQGIPIKYKAKVIQFRSPYKEIMLDFLDKDGEFNKVVPIESGFRITDKSGKPSNVDEISPGSDIELIGENINYKDKYNELRITKKYIGEDVELSGIIEFKNNETGISIIDGQSMQLSPGTAIKGESKLKGQKYTSIKEISLGNFMNCKGTRRKDGTIEVTSASVKENMHDITDDELRKSLGDEFSFKNLTAISIPANLKSKYSGNTTDTLKGGYVEFGGVTRFRLLDNIDVQAYVSNIGFKLLPQWVKDIPSDVPEKINFKFYVLENPIFNAFALPNGMVFV